MKKIIVIVILLVVVGFSGVFVFQKWKLTASSEARLSQTKTTRVEARDINFAISVAGDISPADQVSVRPEINGRIQTLPVDLGDGVKKGKVLFTLDDADLQIEKSTRITEIDGAKLQLERARRNFERSKELFENKLISLELFEDTKTEFELAQNSLQRAGKALNLLEDKLTKTQILAPFDCTILTRPVSVGQAVSGSGGFNSGTEVLTIANLNEMVVNAHINQADVARLAINQLVDIQIDSVAGLKIKGVIDRIAPQAALKNGIKGFAARIQIKEIDARVRPGMTANISIPVATAENVLAVPLAAVFYEKDGKFAYVKKGEVFERRPIQVGVADYFFAEVQQGLQSGDLIALELPEGKIEGKSDGDSPGKPAGSGGKAGVKGGGNHPTSKPQTNGGVSQGLKATASSTLGNIKP